MTKYICNHFEGCPQKGICQHSVPHKFTTYDNEMTKSCENGECEEVIFEVECIDYEIYKPNKKRNNKMKKH